MRVSVKGFEGLYEIDDFGNVYTSQRQGSRGGPMAAKPSTGGYCRVTLRNGANRTTKLIHRLVAEHFVPNPNARPCVNHIDGDKTNNHASNLEWCTYSENMKHAVKHGLNRTPDLRGDEHPNRKLSEAAVRDIRRKSAMGATAKELSGEYGVTEEQIRNVVLGRQWRCVPT